MEVDAPAMLPETVAERLPPEQRQARAQGLQLPHADVLAHAIADVQIARDVWAELEPDRQAATLTQSLRTFLEQLCGRPSCDWCPDALTVALVPATLRRLQDEAKRWSSFHTLPAAMAVPLPKEVWAAVQSALGQFAPGPDNVEQRLQAATDALLALAEAVSDIATLDQFVAAMNLDPLATVLDAAMGIEVPAVLRVLPPDVRGCHIVALQRILLEWWTSARRQQHERLAPAAAGEANGPANGSDYWTEV